MKVERDENITFKIQLSPTPEGLTRELVITIYGQVGTGPKISEEEAQAMQDGLNQLYAQQQRSKLS